jgi:hypothetical protein
VGDSSRPTSATETGSAAWRGTVTFWRTDRPDALTGASPPGHKSRRNEKGPLRRWPRGQLRASGSPGNAPVSSTAMEHTSDDLREQVGEPFVYTFTAHLSFVLGIPDHLGHTLWLHAPWADTADAARFGERPFINIRVFTATTPGLPAWPPGTHQALERFYGYQLDDDPDSRYGEESLTAHDQWISLETPSALVAPESAEEDPAYAFHRCLSAFNLFLQGVLVATRDVRIRPISSHDLRPIVIIGALVPGKGWRLLTQMWLSRHGCGQCHRISGACSSCGR